MVIDNLLIITHVPHYLCQDKLYAYGPYVREIDAWASLFPEIRIACPFFQTSAQGDCLAFTAENISILPQRQTGGKTFGAKFRQILALPVLLWSLAQAMNNASAIHLRCPGNLGLLGILLAPLFSRRIIAKYAGQWTGYPGEPLTFALQRKLLRSYWWRGPVTVYGNWPPRRRHIVPFFTSILDQEQIERARKCAGREFYHPIRILFVGRLTREKRVDTLLAALAQLKENKLPFECKIIGDGPEKENLWKQVEQKRTKVSFTGALPFAEVLDYYSQSDVLVLASKTEGWPKTIAEVMTFGMICIGTNRGMVPQMLTQERGITITEGDTETLVNHLTQIIQNPEKYREMRRQAAEWGQKHSLEQLTRELHALLCNYWNVKLQCR